MVSFENLSINLDSPIYMQILWHVKRGIAAGDIVSGEEMPSRRVLSALLGVNPNTAQKAYALLEEEGIIKSRSGAKSFVDIGPEAVENIRAEISENAVRRLIYALKDIGLSLEEAKNMVEKYWIQEEHR